MMKGKCSGRNLRYEQMKKLQATLLKTLRKLYAKAFIGELPPYDRGVTDFNQASELIYDLLVSGKPCMVARFGAFELNVVVNYCGVSRENHSMWDFIRGNELQWWWNKSLLLKLQTNAGVFPISHQLAARFSELMLEDMKQVDILGSWQRNEQMMIDEYCLKLQKVTLLALEPYRAIEP